MPAWWSRQNIGAGATYLFMGSKGTHFSLCQDLPDMPGPSRRGAPDATQFTPRLSSSGDAVSIPEASIPSDIEAGINIRDSDGSGSGPIRVFHPTAWPRWMDRWPSKPPRPPSLDQRSPILTCTDRKPFALDYRTIRLCHGFVCAAIPIELHGRICPYLRSSYQTRILIG